MPCFFTQLFAPTLSVALLTFLPASLQAQDTPASSQPPANTVVGNTTPPKVTLDVVDVDLRTVLKMMFTSARVSFTMDADVPNTKLNFKVVDQPLDTVLALILRENSSEGKRLTYVRESSIYKIRVVPETSEATSTMRTSASNVPVESLVPHLQYLVPEATILADPRSNGILISGTKKDVELADQGIQMLDVAPKNLVLKAEVVLVLAGKGKENRNALLSTVLRSQAGQEAEGEDKISVTPTQISKLLFRAKALPMGNGTYEVTTRWDVTLPLSASQVGANGKKQSLVQIEKRVTNTTRFTPGHTNVVGGIILNQYGLKGEILFFLTIEEVEEGKKK